jgi:hypothetical protein
MNPTLAKILLTIALLSAGVVGIRIAMNTPPSEPQAVAPSPESSIVPVEQPQPKPTAAVKKTRSQDFAEQFDRSLAGKLLKDLSGAKDAKVREAEDAIAGFIKQKTDEQREYLKQIVLEAISESLSGVVPQGSDFLTKEFKGMELTPDQEKQIQQARETLRSQTAQMLQANPEMLMKLQADLQAGKLDETFSKPLKAYSDQVSGILTPEQRQEWQKRLKL